MTLSSALLQLAGRHHRHSKGQDGGSLSLWGSRSKGKAASLASRNEAAQQQRPPCRARTTHTAEDTASEDDRNATSDHSDHEHEHSMAAIRSTSAALEVGRCLAHLHEHPQPHLQLGHRSGSETDSVGSTASAEQPQDHATRTASLVQQLLEYSQGHPEVLAKRCFSTHATLWLRAAEAGQVGLLRAFVAIVQENAAAVRSAVLRRYMLRIGAPDLSDVKVLLLKLLNGATVTGMTPLHVAAIRGHADVVQFLLEQGADAWRTDPVCFRTPLHYACIAGKADVVAVLLQAMGNEHDMHGTRYIEATTETGMTPLLYAAGLGYPEVVRLLLRAGADWMAAKLNDMPDPHVQASCMSNPLHLAATIGNTEIALDLLKAYMMRLEAHPRGTPGAPRDPRRVPNIFNAQPHHMASASQHTEVARLLHPSRHLHELFGLQQLAGTGVEAPAAVPSLAVLAAAALQAKLLADLEALSPTASEAVPDAAATAAAGAGGASSSAACLLHAAADAAAAAEGDSTATAPVDDGDDDDAVGLCDVCMDCRSDCLIESCRHRMCATCASNLCSRMRSAPMRCPFCRGAIAAFAPLPGARRAIAKA